MGSTSNDVRPMRQLYVIMRQSPPSPQIFHYSRSSFIVCLTYILETMCLSWICTELILKNTEQSVFHISSMWILYYTEYIQ